ncbi:hypothetical protein T492DRAFT_583349 [Pavlovales sp. CCMP2436]|nr:hypothetical protein T492DRAFT_583349 [Pavlovales sp. CCMP2436]
MALLSRPAFAAVSTRLAAGRSLARAAYRPAMASSARIMLSTSAGDPSITATCQAKIKAGLNAQEVQVQGAYDDPNGSHITIYAVASAFEGLGALKRQQLVYKFIWEELQGPVHAVDRMVLKTPAEVSSS